MSRPLSARSVIASTLLGTDPPVLPGALLVALASEFGIASGTARVALSRMVDKGELRRAEGTYALDGDLLVRKEAQDAARAVGRAAGATGAWRGEWLQVVIVGAARPAAERAAHRRDLRRLKLAELREGVWMRPGNLDARRTEATRLRSDPDFVWSKVVPDAPAQLPAKLWDLDRWAAEARALVARLDEASASIDAGRGDLEAGFVLSADTLRHLVADPELPPELAPPRWPSVELRAGYGGFDERYRALLRAFFKQARAAGQR